MRFGLPIATLAFIFSSSTTCAFIPSSLSKSSAFFTTRLHAEEETKAPEAATAGRPAEIEAGSHDELMYTLGVNLARQLGDIRPLVESNDELTLVAKGLLDAVIGRVDEVEQRKLLATRGEDLNNIIVERANKIRQRIEDAGREMLVEMEQQEGAYKIDGTGVVIHPLEAGPEGWGNGVRPTAASTVKVHYHGTLPDGTIFDSSLGGDPVTIALGQVIPGWKSGLLKMHEGETVMLGIPPESAYGEKGTPDGLIPGGASVFFKVQLVEVLSAGIGGSPKLLGVDGKAVKKGNDGDKAGGGLLGADGKPLF
mmetsp:Transcript_11552/g.15509  ORF Transcript_11552/g.15509 Transcript_11552/m.15509 type:complete len:310 (-) Transcript_11552:18-947(-)